jgi:predicted RNA-binding protein
MCQATVYLERNGDQELVMNDVANLLVEGDTVWVSQLLEEPVAVQAIIKEADFLRHTVVLAAIEDMREGES